MVHRSTDAKNHKLFKQGGFENFRGRVRIDNVIFNYVIRSGKAKFGDVFYDINLEVDQILPRTKDASEIKKSTSKNSISQNEENATSKSITNDIYGKDISLDIPIRDDIAPVQEDVEEVNTTLPENTTPDLNLPTPETVQAEEATVTQPEKWLENKLARIEKHLERDIEEVNAEYNERIANAFSQQAIEGIETERLHKIDELEVEAEKERAKARDSAEMINRKELHETIMNDIKAGFAEQGYDFDKVLVEAKNKSTFS